MTTEFLKPLSIKHVKTENGRVYYSDGEAIVILPEGKLQQYLHHPAILVFLAVPTIGQRLKLIRDYSGMSQAEFANAVGVTQTEVSALERNSSKPGWETLTKICRKFNLSMALFETKEPL